MVAFINEFIISTVSFLNEFMTKCETKFIEFEQKMQRIEASLLIVEAKVLKLIDLVLPGCHHKMTRTNIFLDGFYTRC